MRRVEPAPRLTDQRAWLIPVQHLALARFDAPQMVEELMPEEKAKKTKAAPVPAPEAEKKAEVKTKKRAEEELE